MGRILIAALLLCLTPVAFAQWFREDPLDPKTYISPSGRYTLWVNPTHPEGEGPADYRLSASGKVLWKKRLPFTLRSAVLLDSGSFGGYGYSHGTDGFSNNRKGYGLIDVAIVAPNGSIALHEKHQRRASRMMHSHPDPQVEQTLVDYTTNRMILRTEDTSRGDSWWVYKLDTATRLKDIRLGQVDEDTRFVVNAASIPGTPLVLVNWWRYDDAMGATFTIVDESGKTVWRLDRRGDYELGMSEDKQDELREGMQERGAILGVAAKSFDLRFVTSGQRVSFAVNRRNDAWKVTEAGRNAYQPPSMATTSIKELAIPSVSLRLLGKVVLPLEPPRKSSVGDVGEFHVIGPDRVAYLRGGKSPAVVVTNSAGKILNSVRLPVGAQVPGEERHLAWAGATRFIVISSRAGENGSGKAWSVDTSKGSLSALTAFKSNPVDAAAGFPDGSFVVLATQSSRYSFADELAMYTPDGRRLWMHTNGGGYGGMNEELLSPEDVAVDSKGRIAVLDNIRNRIVFYHRSGKYKSNINLEKVWKNKPSYPTNLSADLSGGFLLDDFDNENGPLKRLDANGAIRLSHTPKFADGKVFDVRQDLRVDSAGRLWVTDGNALFRLSSKGIVDKTIGAPLPTSGLTAVADLHVDVRGQIYAVDTYTANVHVFDKYGRQRFVAKPLHSDYEKRPAEYVRMSVARSGDIFLMGGTTVHGYLHFSPTGRRVGYHPYPKGAGSSKPKGILPQWRWIGDELIDEKGRVISILRRWPNHDWMLGGPSAVAPDGSLMSFEAQSNRFWEARRAGQRLRIATFSPTGIPLSMTNLPAGLGQLNAAAYDGQNAYFLRESDIVAISGMGRVLWRFSLPSPKRNWQIFPLREGLALYDGVRTVYRFAKPSGAK